MAHRVSGLLSMPHIRVTPDVKKVSLPALHIGSTGATAGHITIVAREITRAIRAMST
jgi:hypothetical protein